MHPSTLLRPLHAYHVINTKNHPFFLTAKPHSSTRSPPGAGAPSAEAHVRGNQVLQPTLLLIFHTVLAFRRAVWI